MRLYKMELFKLFQNKIFKIVKGRWEIEESFRIMKSDFLARPVNLSREDRIKAHFMTCFILYNLV